MSEEPKTITVCAIVGPAEHLKRAWVSLIKKQDEECIGDYYAGPLWMDIKESDEWVAMDKAVKMIGGEENES